MNVTHQIPEASSLVDRNFFSLAASAGCAGLLLLIGYVLAGSFYSSKARKLPPGPKGKPIIGNMFDMPPKGAGIEAYWTRYRNIYGPISSLTVMGQHFIIINDAQTATELLNKRSLTYSGRPHMVFAGELCGYADGMVLVQPNKDFRFMRAISHSTLGSTMAIQKWNTDIDMEVRRYLYRTLNEPANFFRHLRDEAGAIILRILYGYNISSQGNDVLVDLIGDVMDEFSVACLPGSWIVDLIPPLKYLPTWFPGAGFQRQAAIWKQDCDNATAKPFEFARYQMSKGIAPLSVVSETMSKYTAEVPMTEREIHLLKWACLSFYAGGADTSVAVMEVFYLAMVLYPRVLATAQEEVDAVVGNGRLPDLSDQARLPYIEALIKETLRWEPITETPFPHMTTEDDSYGDYFIPKGSMVITNIIGMFHDPEMYKDPTVFRPERFLGPNPEPDPHELMWGFGRRICPGRFLAGQNLYLSISRTVAVFNIRAVEGHLPKVEFTQGVVRRPFPYKADIKIRSPQHEALVRHFDSVDPFSPEGDGPILKSLG